MHVSTLQKYKGKSLPQLLRKATTVFNAYIRKRDEGKPCISCSQFRTLQAGHYYPAGQYPLIRFDERNVNGECVRCNYYVGDHLIHYRTNLIQRIGIDEVETLDGFAGYNKQIRFKWSRIELIEIIEKYK